MTSWHLEIGDGGWLHVQWNLARLRDTSILLEGLATADAFVRVAERAHGQRLRIAEVAVEDPTSTKLRAVPLAAIEEWINEPALVAKIRRFLDTPAARPRDAFPTPNKARRASSPSDPTKREPLQRPNSYRLGDEFYTQVAAAYRAAVGSGQRPRVALATEAGVPSETAGTWIKEARKRGLIGSPSGRRGANAST